MHEFSIASSLVEMLQEFAEKDDQQSKLLEVHIRVGKLRAISIEQLKFSYKTIAKDKFLEGSKLIVEEAPALAHCPKCGFMREFELVDDSYHFGLPTLSCPRCEATMNLEGGDDVVVTKLRVKRHPKK